MSRRTELIFKLKHLINECRQKGNMSTAIKLKKVLESI